MTEPAIRNARREDEDSIVALMEAYYAEDGYRFHGERAKRALSRLVGDPSLGRVWVVVSDDDAVGYVVLTFGYSLEYLGRDAFVDELYVDPAWRGRGLGRLALRVVEDACRDFGVNAIHLEVERDKKAARGLYQASGFTNHHRYLMTKWLDPP